MKQFCEPIESNTPLTCWGRLLLLLLMLGGTMGRASAQKAVATEVKAQTFGLEASELQNILQKCLDLPAMQKYYPVAADNTLLPVNVMQLPIAFPVGMAVVEGGQPVNFLAVSKSEYSRMVAPAAYAMFRTIEHTDNSVLVHFNYFYKGVEQKMKPLFVVVAFEKMGTKWNVTTSSVKE